MFAELNPPTLPTTPTTRPRTRDVVAFGAVIVVAWTAFALLSITHFFLGKSAAGAADASFRDLASHILVFYWGWAFVTPLILFAARDLASRMHRTRGEATVGWLRTIVIALFVLLIHAVWYLGVVRIVGIEPTVRIDAAQLGDYFMRHAGGDLATYAAIVGAVLLIDARRRARERELAATALEARLARADAELLRWQLQPHFLFNTLNTVSTLVLKGETQSADRAIGLIARWLRDALSQRADAIVTLAEELTTVQQYVAIEALRFGDALRLEVRADGDALVARVPALIVQPLVENAVRHGFAASDDRAPITISARARDGRLRISVRNRDATRGAIFADAPTSTHSESAGFGLRYVRERLAHFYGDDAHLELITDGLDVIATLDIATAPRQQIVPPTPRRFASGAAA
ncbi:MAG TPA: histidine kinase [Gemmatimonadaceae bacterium]|jgi:two-component sensor histidine kinase